MQLKNLNSRREKLLNTVFACLLMLTLLVFAGIPAMEQAQALKQITSEAPSDDLDFIDLQEDS